MRRQESRAGDLRAAIDRLPLSTRQAMLEGIEANPIVVGGDGDPRGGVCPVYAIARPPSKQVGRPFARAWDRYAAAWMPRPATERELRTLRSMLETSIELETEPAVFLDAAIAAHKASQARSRVVRERQERAPRPDSGERDRTGELSRRHGWAWLRPVRRYDDYERMLEAVDGMAQEACAESDPERLLPSSAGRG